MVDDSDPVIHVTMLFLLVSHKLCRSINLPCYECEGRITLVVLLIHCDSAKPFTVIYHQFNVYLYLNTQQNYSIPINVLVTALSIVVNLFMSIIVNYVKKPWYLKIEKLTSSVLIQQHPPLRHDLHLKEVFVQRFPN